MRLSRLRNQNGLTLIEVMIALVLSGLVIAGLFSLFLITRRNEDISRHLNKQGEKARFISEFIARDLRMAGYQRPGCSFNGAKALDWGEDKQTLTIRYCQVSEKDPSSAEKKTRFYYFEPDGEVDYKSGNNRDPLIEGVYLKNIWFGKKTTSGFKYVPQDSSGFSDIRSVRMRLRIRGEDSANDSAEKKPQQTFYLTTAIRNNLLGESSNTETKQPNMTLDPDK